MIEERFRPYRWARAYRDGELVCGRVELTVSTDTRLVWHRANAAASPARFLEHLDSALHTELAELVRRRGAVARRAAERMEPIELVFDDPRLGRQQIIGWLEPPQLRRGDLHDIEFGLREPRP